MLCQVAFKCISHAFSLIDVCILRSSLGQKTRRCLRRAVTRRKFTAQLRPVQKRRVKGEGGGEVLFECRLIKHVMLTMRNRGWWWNNSSRLIVDSPITIADSDEEKEREMCRQTGRQTVGDNEFSIVAHQHIRYLKSHYDSLHSYKTNYYDHFRGSLECINKYINSLRPSWICKTYTGYTVNEIVLIICRAVSYAYLWTSRILIYSFFFIKLSYLLYFLMKQ